MTLYYATYARVCFAVVSRQILCILRGGKTTPLAAAVAGLYAEKK